MVIDRKKYTNSFTRPSLFIVVMFIAFFCWFHGIYANDGAEYYQQYIKESQILVVACPSKSEIRVRSWNYYAEGIIESPLVTKTMVDYTFYDSISNQYYQLMFSNPSFGDIADSIQSRRLVLMINDDLFKISPYGSVSKPIPVFRYMYAGNDFRQEGGGTFYHLPSMENLFPSRKESEITTIDYLSYIMTRNDFNWFFKKRRVKKT